VYTSGREGDDLNIRGSRGDATAYYCEGVRVRGNLAVVFQICRQITTITGGVPAPVGASLVALWHKQRAESLQGIQLRSGFATSETVQTNSVTTLASVFVSGPISYQTRFSRRAANQAANSRFCPFAVTILMKRTVSFSLGVLQDNRRCAERHPGSAAYLNLPRGGFKTARPSLLLYMTCLSYKYHQTPRKTLTGLNGKLITGFQQILRDAGGR
jgi:hypothetical protein